MKKWSALSFLTFLIFSLILTSCIPQGSRPHDPFASQSLQQSPELEGDFEQQSQLSSVDRIFSVIKSGEEELSELTTVSLSNDQSPGAFSLVSKEGCERPLKRQERCFVKVRFSGKTQLGQSPGVRTGKLNIGSLEIPLSVNYDPVVNGSVELSDTSFGSIEESMDYECFQNRCDLILKYKNTALIPLLSGSVVVPLGYQVLVNSCNVLIPPGKTCGVKLRIGSNVQDLERGNITLNSNGEAISTNIRVLRENDVTAPSISTDVVGSVFYGSDLYLLGDVAGLNISLSDDRPASKGLQYRVSKISCEDNSVAYASTVEAENYIEVEGLNLSSNNNILYISAKDALDNKSCVPLDIKNLSLKQFSVAVTQPTLGLGLSVSNTSPFYNGSVSITYSNPGVGYEILSWTGACSGTVGNSCVLNNISQNASVGINVGCSEGYHSQGSSCLINTYSVSLNQPTAGGLLTLSSPNPVNYGESRTISFNPGVGYEILSWTGACSGTVIGNPCVLNNIMENKSVGIELGCSLNYESQGGVCSIKTYILTLTQPTSGGVLSLNLPSPVNHGDSRTVTFTPGVGFNFSWAGDCVGASGNSCLISNIVSSKSVSVTTSCKTGYFFEGGSCVPLDSCKTILAKIPSSVTDGVYTLVDSAGQPYSAYCNMAANGGGWTLVFAPISGEGYTTNGGYDANHAIWKGNDVRAVNHVIQGTTISLANTQKAVKNVKFKQISFMGNSMQFSLDSTTFATKFTNKESVSNLTGIPGLTGCSNGGWDRVTYGSHTETRALFGCYAGSGYGDDAYIGMGVYSTRRNANTCGTGGQGGSAGGGDTAGAQYYCGWWYQLGQSQHRGGTIYPTTGKTYMIWVR